ncbi:MAG: penicillin-binding protein 1A [Burkholderiaceae bacterium]
MLLMRSVRNIAKAQRGFSVARLLAVLVAIPITALVCGALVVALAVLLTNDRLPQLDSLLDYRPQIPMRVYSADGKLIGEFGEERRTFVRIEDVPAVMKNAVLAAEDARFFEHSGVDPIGVVRAFLANLSAGTITQGSSTLTMQLAREFFLSPERTYSRKVTEALLALRIEDTLTKDEILELYLNQIFLGRRAYGFAAAARTYFDKTLDELNPAEAAMLAGLPKAPSRYNPFVNPQRATERQRYILRRMRENNFLTEEQYRDALDTPLEYASGRSSPEDDRELAPYVAELARQLTQAMFEDDSYTAGLRVYTTIDTRDQQAAREALRNGVMDYDTKHGYRGPETYVKLPDDPEGMQAAIETAVDEAGNVNEFLPAVVTAVSAKAVTVDRGDGSPAIDISGKGLAFVKRALGSRAPAAIRLQPGALVRIVDDKDGWRIAQLPQVQAAFVAMNTADGSVRALVGGYDFERNKFNRVTQAWRQPGSSFKPFIYSAALEKGFMVSTIINDAPFSIDPALTGGELWEPKNYDGKFEGPMTMAEGLARSKNMVSIRILQQIGPDYAQDYISRFGFDAGRHPSYLTMALGAGAVTPWQMAGGFSVFANGGYRVEPYVISKITNSAGEVLAAAKPRHAGDPHNRAIDPRNAFIMDSMLRDVVRYGTATRARTGLKRNDLAGKTGTTNDSHDAWFAGYQHDIAAVAWVGFDQPRKLGNRETGGGLALPIWVDYMRTALDDKAQISPEPPGGIVQIGADWYYSETRPGQGIATVGLLEGGVASGENADRIRDQLF